MPTDHNAESEDYDDATEDEDDRWEFDCGRDRHGNCGKAGSEECDFECPYRDGL